MSKVEAALAWAARGFHVFPCAPNLKKSIFNGWQAAATTDEEVIRDWWKKWPKANIGTLCKAPLVAVDLDVKDDRDGVASWEALGQRLGETFTVRTPSGGYHLYFTSETPVAQIASTKLGEGIDTRCEAKGLTLGPGSTIKGRPYEILHDLPIAPLPDDIAALIRSDYAADPRIDTPVVELDLDESVEAAREWLQSHPPAVEGSGGDAHTFATCCELRRYGLTEAVALEILTEEGGWNEKCQPPWKPDELAVKVRNGSLYGRGAAGDRSPAAAANAFEAELDSPFSTLDLTSLEVSAVQPRAWLYGRLLMRGAVTMTSAAPGTGKTTLAVAEALSMATGESFLGDDVKVDGLRVRLWSLEEPRDEMLRRLWAIQRRFRLPALRNLSLLEADLCLAKTMRGSVVYQEPVVDRLVAALKEDRIDVLVVDPFVASHQAPENDNTAMNHVLRLWEQVAQRARVAVHLIHHTTKARSEDGPVSRGAGAILGVVRVHRTLQTMPDKVANELQIEKEDQVRYVKVGGTLNDKANYGPRSGGWWYELVPETLPNGGLGEADEVAVPVPWAPRPATSTVTEALRDEVVRAIDAEAIAGRPCREDRRAKLWAGHVLMEALGVDPRPSGHQYVQALLNGWLEDGTLQRVEMKDGKRRPRTCIVSASYDPGA